MTSRSLHTSHTLIGLLVCLSVVVSVYGQPSQFRVSRVVDGDTVVVESIGTVRLIGIDTPETVDPRRPVQRFGKEAADFLRQLVEGRRVRLEYDWNRKDGYNRTLAYLYLPDGTLVNAEVVRLGYGFAYTRFPFKRLEEFRRLEREAREKKLGLWAPDVPTAAPFLPRGGQQLARVATVYITKTGAKYHRLGCRVLGHDSIAMAVTEAAKRYGPCAICRPPAP